MYIRVSVLSVLLLASSAFGADLKTLSRLAGVPIGALHDRDGIGDEPYETFLAAEFANLVVSRSMARLQPNPGPNGFDLSDIDPPYDFAEANGMRVLAQPLVYRNASTPSWVFGNPVDCSSRTPNELRKILREYISVVLPYRAHLVDTWTVVNEPLLTTEENNCFKAVFGYPGYVVEAMKIAQGVRDTKAPHVRLRINEQWGGEHGPEANIAAMFALVDTLTEHGVKPDVIGTQCHLRVALIDGTGKDDTLRTRFRMLLAGAAQRGIQVHVSEIDVYEEENEQEDFEEQAAVFAAILEECLRWRGVCTQYATWGSHDGNTWLVDQGLEDPDPLLFDADLQPKLAVFALERTYKAHIGRTPAHSARSPVLRKAER